MSVHIFRSFYPPKIDLSREKKYRANPSDILIRMTVKAIIFDLGGVLLRTADFSPRERLAARLGMSRAQLEDFIFGGESGVRAQKGEITVNEHWENLQHQLNCTRQEFTLILDEFFGQDQLDGELMGYVRGLHQTYKTALLSNAWDDLRQVIAEKWQFEDAFDAIIISAEVGVAKPDPRIFHLTLDRLGVNASGAVFVDDMAENIGAARSVGMNAIQFKTAAQVKWDIEQLLDGK
jgi:glucose-1-phosphatase